MDEQSIAVRLNEDAHRFEAEVPGGLAVLEFNRARNLIVFTHTEVPEAAEGQGVGAALAKTALDWAREEGEPVMPLCPFVASYIRRHPEYRDLVMPGFNL